ncbi:unnamed protein product [Pleuronectes platessa]|uniref:Uncharacterized protein n=1 Tax=Pleuronectes platessa TaxID=8262 RepID=A0A9N7ZBA8_PLEPL|nr:unnamed protein product [Pleuronectes platessa]
MHRPPDSTARSDSQAEANSWILSFTSEAKATIQSRGEHEEVDMLPVRLPIHLCGNKHPLEDGYLCNSVSEKQGGEGETEKEEERCYLEASVAEGVELSSSNQKVEQFSGSIPIFPICKQKVLGKKPEP